MSDQYDKVRSELCKRLGNRTAWYVLVDPAIDDPLKDCEERDRAVPLPIRHQDMPGHFRPYLLKLGDIGRDVRIDRTVRVAVDEATRKSPQNGSKRAICGWLASEQTIEALATNLMRHARIVVHRRSRLFRVWDPRTLDFLQHLLSAQSMSMLAPPETCWWWLGRTGSVKELQGAPVQVERNAGLQFSDEDIETLLLGESLHSVLNVLQDMTLDAVAENTVRTIVGALRRARREWGIVDSGDQVRFALHACLIHEAFDTDEKVQLAMRAAPASPVRALLSFDEQEWVAVRERLNLGRTGNEEHGKEMRHHG